MLTKSIGRMTVEASNSEIEAFRQEGNQFFSAGDYVKAVAAYNRAIKADPKNGLLYRYVSSSTKDPAGHTRNECLGNDFFVVRCTS